MEKIKIIEFLEKFNFNYIEKGNLIFVKLDFSQEVIIDFSEEKMIKINDTLKSWNFLTGSIQMNLKNAFKYNFILTIFFGFFCLYVDFKDYGYNFLSLFLIFITWIIMFTNYYLIKLENFKKQVFSLL